METSVTGCGAAPNEKEAFLIHGRGSNGTLNFFLIKASQRGAWVAH